MIHRAVPVCHLLPVALSRTFTSPYNKWYASERSILFNTRPILSETTVEDRTRFFKSSLPKVGTNIEMDILRKLSNCSSSIGESTDKHGKELLYYTRKSSFFLQFLNFIPEVRGEDGVQRDPSELKALKFEHLDTRNLSLAILSSSLFFWYNTVNSDCRNLNKREVVSFPIPDHVPGSVYPVVDGLIDQLMADYRANSELRTVRYQGKGAITVQYFNFRPSKPILDDIDRLLGPIYGLTAAETDFIVNYEIKYRLGSE